MNMNDTEDVAMTVKYEWGNAETKVAPVSCNTPETHPDEKIYSEKMSTEVSRFGNVGYTGSLEDDFKGIEKPVITPESRKLIERIIELGADGHEHGIALIDGISYEFTSDLKNQVSIPPEISALLDAEGTKDVKLYCNHPNDTAPSAADLELLLKNRANEIVTVCSNGNVHVITNEGGMLPSADEYEAFIATLAGELDSMLQVELVSGSMTIEDGNYIFVKEQAYRIVRHFGWQYEGGHIDELF